MSVDKLRTYQQVLTNSNSNSNSPGSSSDKNNNEGVTSNMANNKNKDTNKDRDDKDFERSHSSNCITRSADTIDDSSPFGEMVLSTGTSPSKGLDSDDIVPEVAEDKQSGSGSGSEVEGTNVGAANKLADIDSSVNQGARRETERRQSHQSSKGDDEDRGSAPSPSISPGNLGVDLGLESETRIERNIGLKGMGSGTPLSVGRTQDQILSSSSNSNGKRDSISGFNALAVSKDGKMV